MVTGRNAPVTLVSPGGAKVKCAANKRIALAVATLPVNGEPALTVIFRTDKVDGVTARARTEAKKRGRPVLVFSLTTGIFLGSVLPNGTTNKIGVTA